MPDLVEAEQALRAQLAQIESDHAETMDALTQATAAREGEMTTAGSQYDAAEQQAQEEFNAALAAYDEQLQDQQQSLDDVTAELEAIEDYQSQAAAIAAIGTVDNPAITTGGTPDCSAADIEVALNSALDQVRAMREGMLAVFTALDQYLANGNLNHLKTAIEKGREFSQSIQSPLPPAADVEAEKQAALSELQGML